MNESWNKYIQPILDAWEWDHFSWIWEPFFAQYPKFSSEQRTPVEDALAFTAFDRSDEKLAIKALSIAEELHRANLATPRLSELFRSELRKQFQALPIDQDITHYYIFAFSTFELIEAVPFIKSLIGSLEAARFENHLFETKETFQILLRACCISLLCLNDDDAIYYLSLFIERDLRVKALNMPFCNWSSFSTIGLFWKQLGLGGFRKLVGVLQGWQKGKLSDALPLLKEAIESIHSFESSQEKQEALDLVENLQRGISVH